MMTPQSKTTQSGFTLIEVIVSTAIFVLVVAAMLTLFDYTLKVNRRVQALREVAQGTRTFAETLTREIRNGRIDYDAGTWAVECDAENYTEDSATAFHKSLALISRAGDKLCFYFDTNGTPAVDTDDSFKLKKQTPNGTITATVFQSSRFRVVPSTFRFIVVPETDPKVDGGSGYPGLQPYVTIIAQFEMNINDITGPTKLNYQTTISTDVYDIPHAP